MRPALAFLMNFQMRLSKVSPTKLQKWPDWVRENWYSTVRPTARLVQRQLFSNGWRPASCNCFGRAIVSANRKWSKSYRRRYEHEQPRAIGYPIPLAHAVGDVQCIAVLCVL